MTEVDPGSRKLERDLSNREIALTGAAIIISAVGGVVYALNGAVNGVVDYARKQFHTDLWPDREPMGSDELIVAIQRSNESAPRSDVK